MSRFRSRVEALERRSEGPQFSLPTDPEERRSSSRAFAKSAKPG